MDMDYIFEKYLFEDLYVGMETSSSNIITDHNIREFAMLSGDHNPVHLDDNYASTSRFKKRIAHGLMSASYFSALFGTRIPGPGCVYVAQSLQFKKPVYIDDEVVATVVIQAIDSDKRRVTFSTNCTVSNKVVISGSAELYVP
jgi:3-hydroxybutyryl-CoA dehydratase